MKKSIVLLFIIVGVLAAGITAYADAEDVPEWFYEMIEWRKAEVQESLDAGEITEEQAEAWLAHFDDMVEFHEASGFTGFGGCHGGRGFGGRGPGYGMGAGFGWNQN